MKIPPPPVPAQLREMLKDYPELIQKLQDNLDELVQDILGGTATPPFEQALWVLEDTLSGFISQAHRELEAANVSGDPQIIKRAEEKASLMRRASQKIRWISDDSMANYFQDHKGAFE